MSEKKPPPGFQEKVDAIASAVLEDCLGAFERFSKERGAQQITGFALCTVDDASPPYIKGATVEDGFGIPCLDEVQGRDGFSAEPADWDWSDEAFQRAHGYQCEKPIAAVLDDSELLWEERQGIVFRGMVEGMKKFDATGKFAGKLPREQMLLMVWIHDPESPTWVMEWVTELNPEPVADWFNVVYPYRDGA